MCKIKFDIQKPGPIQIIVNDIAGVEISTMADQYENPGSYEVDFNDENLMPGKYYYKIYDSEVSHNGNGSGLNGVIKTGTLIIGNYSYKNSENLHLSDNP